MYYHFLNLILFEKHAIIHKQKFSQGIEALFIFTIGFEKYWWLGHKLGSKKQPHNKLIITLNRPIK